jgi:hypothetical protein
MKGNLSTLIVYSIVDDAWMSRLMCKYDDVTLDLIPLTLVAGEKEHVLVPQDECIVNVNKGPQHRWLKGDQQPLKKKGNRHAIHICGWICEITGHLNFPMSKLLLNQNFWKCSI